MEQLLLQQGVIAYQANDPNKAESLFKAVLQIAPGNLDALHFLGLSCASQKKHALAIKYFDQAIAANPGIAAFHTNLASSQRELCLYAEALASTDRALQLDPNMAEALNTRGNILRVQGRLDEALESLDQAIRLQPDFHEAHDNRGNVLRDLGRLDEAIESYRKARRIAPRYASAAWNESLCLLLKGDFDNGWSLYEAGWVLGLRAPWLKCTAPLWTGAEPLAGKAILIHAEQGLGDTIQFCRYTRVLTQQGARVILEVQAPLAGLLQDLLPDISVIANGSPRLAFDFHIPLLSLPGACKSTLETIPEPSFSLPQKRKTCHPDLETGRAKPRIGLAWAGNPLLENDRNRSIALETLRPLFDMDAEFHYLQPEMRQADEAITGEFTSLVDHRSELSEFRDTARLIQQMDLVISVDTAVAHLAASLAIPTWILLPFVPDWRWLMGRTDSPWYPAAQLFRQNQPGNWENLLQDQLIPALHQRLEAI
jgi:tetratricopeptide (TPR) repeat protein